MYKYWGYGLTIASEIEFPELLPFEFESADIRIVIGETPKALTGDNVLHKVRISISPSEYLLKLVNIANYYAANGKLITIEPMPGADIESIRLFLLSNGLAAILHQRNFILLHASAIEYDGSIVLFCGHSGAGKSTTLSKFKQKGYKVFSDDVVVLKESIEHKGKIDGLASYPIIKLWEDGFEKLKIGAAPENNKLRPQLPKYALFYHDAFNISPIYIKKIFILERNSLVTVPVISELSTIAAFTALQKNAYRLGQTTGMQKQNLRFDMISKLTVQTSVYSIKRPENANSINELCDLIELNLFQNE